MKIQLIRSVTLRLDFAGRRYLIDPWLAGKRGRPQLWWQTTFPIGRVSVASGGYPARGRRGDRLAPSLGPLR